MVLTKDAATKADPGWHADERCQGFALWVKPNGHRVWCLDYRVNGRQRRMTLGRLESMPPVEAAKAALKHRVAINNGRDPLADREAARRAEQANVTLTTFFERYMDEHAKTSKKPRSIEDDRKMFDTNIKQPLGRLRVPDITGQDIARLHRQITARPAPILANRAVALLSSMMTQAERWGVRPLNSNPCKFVQRNPEKKTHRFLTREQLVALGAALGVSERCKDKAADEYEQPVMLAVIRVLLLTGMRKGEALGLRWEDVNIDAGVVDLPDSKTGRKLVTLNAPARQLLAGLPRTSQYVFPGRHRGKPLVGVNHAWLRIRKRAGLDGVRLHDLRHSYASTAAGLGASLPVIGALLGHTVPATTARYAGLADDPRRAAAEAVGKQLEALLTPKRADRNSYEGGNFHPVGEEATAAVVPMRRKRRAR